MTNVTYLFVAACTLCGGSAVVRGFKTSSIVRSPHPRHHGSLLRVATDGIGANGTASKSKDAMIRQIDQKIQNYERKQQKYTAQLDRAKAELAKFQRTRQRYLEGATLAGGPDADARFSETAARSLIKAMLWRVIAGSVTFLTSLRFSGSVATALSIVGSEFFSKATTMFIGERLMNRSQAGRRGGGVDVGRSLAKALLWRAFAIANTLTMSYLVAQDLGVASKITGADTVFKTGLMFAYERAWARAEWGKEYLIEFSI